MVNVAEAVGRALAGLGGLLRDVVVVGADRDDVGLLVFPGEGHELSRAGQPRHRVQRFEHILAWWAEHLG